MKRILLFALALTSGAMLTAQTTILDFEAAGTSTDFQYFGSTLEGSLNSIIANPDASGINSSAMVADFMKPAGAETWAGAFSNPEPTVMADMATNSQICMKVWFNEPGNVALKLENSTNGGPNWITTQTVDQSETWTEICFDASDPSIEDPFSPASTFVYPTVVLFFDFGDSPTEDRTYYFDDLVLTGGSGATEGDVTFSVDMNDYSGTFTTPYVAGTFNDWSADANPMEEVGGGIWTVTIEDIPVGSHEYKIQLDEWAADEQFNGFETCTVTDASGDFHNRSLFVSGDATLETHCFNSCYTCGDAVNITIELGPNGAVVAPEGLHIAGGGNFGNPGDFPMNDDDGDGVWTITVERQKGFSSHFTFTNGACPDWACKEDISGQDCADPDNFNDRFMGPVTQDTTIATCFAECTTSTDVCADPTAPKNITFQVDMTDYADPFTTVFLSGTMNNWSEDANPMEDGNSDGIWETTLMLAPGSYEYKFQLDMWMADEIFMDGDPCTVTDPSGTFVNRLLEVTEDATVCFEFNTCTSCLTNSVRDLAIDHSLFELSPSLAGTFTNLVFSDEIVKQKNVRLMSSTGSLVQEIQLEAEVKNHQLDLTDLAPGLYFVSVQTENKLATQKLVRR